MVEQMNSHAMKQVQVADSANSRRRGPGGGLSSRAASMVPKATHPSEWFQVRMSMGVLTVSLLVSFVVPFLLGRFAGDLLRYKQQRSMKPHTPKQIFGKLPSPILGMHQELPVPTAYFSEQFQTKGTSSESFFSRPHGAMLMTGCSSNQTLVSRLAGKGGQQQQQQQQQHAFLDLRLAGQPSLIKYASSEMQLVHLLNYLLATSTSVVHSYHCHTIATERISCTGLGLATHGYISVHAAPDQLSLDVHGLVLEDETIKNLLGRSLTYATEIERKEHQQPSEATSTSKPTSILSASFRSDATTSALVHPALLAHMNPEVVILVGGSSATVRKILQHKTVARLVIIETTLDWNDNRNGTGTGADPRVEAYNDKAADWFAINKKYMKHSTDVVIVEDARSLDPGNCTTIIHDLIQVMQEDEGILVIQTSLQLQDERKHKLTLVDELTSASDAFDVIREYDEGNTNFLVAFVDDEVAFGRWFANEAEVNLAIRERITVPQDAQVDGVALQSYQFPSRRAETNFCRANPEDSTCKEGHGLDPSRLLVSMSSFEVKVSTVENAGRGVYLKEDANAGSYMFVDGCVNNMNLPDATIRIVEDFSNGQCAYVPLKNWVTLMGYADGYGFSSEQFGARSYDVDPGIATFVNHGCNGTTNVGAWQYKNLTENSECIDGYYPTAVNLITTAYNPAQDRTVRSHGCAENIAMRDIKRGEETFNNYMTFESEDDLEDYAASLRAECAGITFGQVSEYEMARAHKDLLGVTSLVIKPVSYFNSL